MAAKTMFEKIWDRHTIHVEPSGDTLLYVDRCLIHEGSRQVFEKLEREGHSVVRPDQVIACADHYVPTLNREKGLFASIRIEPSDVSALNPLSSTSVTRVSSITSTPSSWRSCFARSAKSSGNAIKTLGAKSSRMIRALFVSIDRKSFRTDLAISASAPAISTPVGPAPTMANVKAARCATGSLSNSACSKARRKRARTSTASSIVLSPGAYRFQASFPK